MQAGPSSYTEHDVLLLLEQKLPEPLKLAARPLPFERLLAGIPFTPQARILKLPYDVLNQIFEHIPMRSLPSFALTSRDCCCLARGRQFANVTLDYSPNSWSLAHSLLAEANLGHTLVNRRARLPFIGPSIRQIRIRSTKEYMEQYHGISIWQPRDISKEKLKEIGDRYQRYIRTVQLVLANSLPNVDTIIWTDRLAFDHATYQALFESRAQHLSLDEVEENVKPNFHASATMWPLRNLNLNVDEVQSNLLESQTKSVWDAMIRPSASHLESLIWAARRGSSNLSGADVKGSIFPALRRLHLAGLGFAHDSVFESLISPESRLRWLGIQRTYAGPYLSRCGTLSSLESLTWLPQPTESDDDLLSFLHSNTHLKELCLRNPVSTHTLDTKLLTLLGSQFNNLASLYLVVEGDVFQESSLELIGKLCNLKCLHLSAGDQEHSFEWDVSHESIRQHLSTLTKLKTLLFSRDIRKWASVSSSEHGSSDNDPSLLDSDGDTSSTNSDDNPNTDLEVIIAAVAHGTGLAPPLAQNAAQAIPHNPEQHNEHNQQPAPQIEDDTSEEGHIGWEFAATSRRPFSITGSEIERSSLSRLLQKMRDEKVEEEAQAYFLTFESLHMVYIGRQAFDRAPDGTCGPLWRNKRWADLGDLFPWMMGRLDV
ncbi:hypothetical protein FKW77_003262 [Venturia effusa]|uniref:F-box domain-containing protein n=1 Tax=Venturia effusa TaxID=50376 RepID=A0A517LIM2_9PEZI|nr:hypothetical protein FKW77_003262 [Venturia effusa]